MLNPDGIGVWKEGGVGMLKRGMLKPGIPGPDDDDVVIPPPGLLQFFRLCPDETVGNDRPMATTPHQHKKRCDMSCSMEGTRAPSPGAGRISDFLIATGQTK